MKIAMIGQKGIPATYGGIERHVEEIGLRLVEAGHQVRVYSRSHYASNKNPFPGIERVSLPSVNTKHLDTASHSLLASLHSLFHGVDLVHFHALGPSALSWIPRLRHIPVVATLHGLDWEREKWGTLATYFLEKCEYPALHVPRKTIVVSKTLRQYFHEKYRIWAEYIPNGVRDAVLQPAEKLEPWGLRAGEYYLFVGRLTPEKGPHFLIDAFNRLNTDRKLVIAGGSAATEDYVASLEEAAGRNVVFTGYVHGDPLHALMTNAYAIVLPSTLEGLSIALLEALSYHRCVLVSDIPENLEVVEDYVPRFRSADVEDLLRALTELDRNPDKVKNYEKAVAEHLAHRFKWESVVTQLMSVYNSVLRDTQLLQGH